MSTVRVEWYAELREQRGLAVEDVTSAARDLGQLYDELRARHGLRLERRHLRVVVDDEFAEWSAPLRDGGRVTFLPPATGG